MPSVQGLLVDASVVGFPVVTAKQNKAITALTWFRFRNLFTSLVPPPSLFRIKFTAMQPECVQSHVLIVDILHFTNSHTSSRKDTNLIYVEFFLYFVLQLLPQT